MRNLLTFLLLLALPLIVFSQQGTPGWYEIDYPGNADLYNLSFINQDTGFVVGNSGTLLKTTDKGDTWEDIYSGSGITFRDIDFVNDTLGFIVGDSLHITQDGWKSWESNTILGWSYADIESIGNICYAASSDYLAYSTDRGENWSTFGDSFHDSVNTELLSFYTTKLHLRHDSTLFFTWDTSFTYEPYEWSEGRLTSLKDPAEWKPVLHTPDGGIKDVYFVNNNTGYCVGNKNADTIYNYAVYSTTDGGAHWDTVFGPPLGNNAVLNAVHFCNEKTGYAVGSIQKEGIFGFEGYGFIIFTNDYGQTWRETLLPDAPEFTDVVAIDSNTALCVGGRKIYKTTNTGIQMEVVLHDTGWFAPCLEPLTLEPGIKYSLNHANLQYSWEPSLGLSDTAVLFPVLTPIKDTTYRLTITDGKDTAWNEIGLNITPPDAPEICMVAVNPGALNNSVIIGNTGEYAKQVNIFKETIPSGTYEQIGSLEAGSLGVFTDTTSNPLVKSTRYRLTMVDSCMNESVPGQSHKTIHLTISSGQGGAWNLIWDAYEGFSVTQYNIYRGTSKENMELINSVAGTATSYTDLNPLDNDMVYQVQAVKADTCYEHMLKSGHIASGSNFASTGGTSVSESSNKGFLVFPNPGNGCFTMNMKGMAGEDKQIFVYDNQGRLITAMKISGNMHEVDMTEAEKGCYYVKIIAADKVYQEKLIIQ